METQAPTTGKILIAIGFALSCFGILLFLWVAFGGPTPLGAEGYKVVIPFREAGALAVQSDVRISGVSVGKVTDITLTDEGMADATLEVDSEFAPIPNNTKSILRQKTLLGETYVELTPGEPATGSLPEGGTLPEMQVSEAVQFDEILRAFEPETRTAFQSWMQNAAVALQGRAADLSLAFAALPPFGAEGNRILSILDTQSAAVRELVSGGADVFGALSERQGQLRGLIENTETVFETTAARNRQLAETFTILPTFLDESQLTLERLSEFAVETDPLVQQLMPVARELAPTVTATGVLAADLERFFRALKPAIPAGVDGLPDLRALLDDDLPPLLGNLDPFFDELTPIIEAAYRYRHEVTAFLGNASAATHAAGPAAGGVTLNYLRTTSPLSPESLAAYPQRLPSNRANPYTKPLGYQRLAEGLESFQTTQCTLGPNLTLTNDPPLINPSLFDRLQLYAFGGVTQTSEVAAPPCLQQGAFAPIGGPSGAASSRYLHVLAGP
jgi:virulence factor Mce-like protein